jgi:plastocyanin
LASGADSKYFEKMQSCNAIQPAFINIINVKTPNGSWQGIDWEFSGIQVVMSDNSINDPKLGVQLSYGLPNKVSSLNLDELDSLPVQKPFNRTSLDVKLTATTNGISGNEITNGDLTVGSDGEYLAFSPITLTANVGETVSLTFKNNSTALSHNFVLVNGGEDVATAVDEAGSDAGEAGGYVPADNANIIASIALFAGTSEQLEFTVPAAGTYTYICTYPAHLGGGMKGTLIVK